MKTHSTVYNTALSIHTFFWQFFSNFCQKKAPCQKKGTASKKRHKKGTGGVYCLWLYILYMYVIYGIIYRMYIITGRKFLKKPSWFCQPLFNFEPFRFEWTCLYTNVSAIRRAVSSLINIHAYTCINLFGTCWVIYIWIEGANSGLNI